MISPGGNGPRTGGRWPSTWCSGSGATSSGTSRRARSFPSGRSVSSRGSSGLPTRSCSTGSGTIPRRAWPTAADLDSVSECNGGRCWGSCARWVPARRRPRPPCATVPVWPTPPRRRSTRSGGERCWTRRPKSRSRSSIPFRARTRGTKTNRTAGTRPDRTTLITPPAILHPAGRATRACWRWRERRTRSVGRTTASCRRRPSCSRNSCGTGIVRSSSAALSRRRSTWPRSCGGAWRRTWSSKRSRGSSRPRNGNSG